MRQILKCSWPWGSVAAPSMLCALPLAHKATERTCCSEVGNRGTTHARVAAGIGAGPSQSNGEAIFAAAVAALGSQSKAISHTALSLLYRFLRVLAVPNILYCDVKTPAIPGSVHGAVVHWVSYSYFPKHPNPVPWRLPTDGEVRSARHFAEQAVAEACSEIDRMVSDGSIADSGHEPRRRLRRAQLMAYAASSSLLSVLLPISLAEGAAKSKASGGADSIAVCDVEAEGWVGCRVVPDVLEMALRVAAHTDSANVDSLNMCITMIEARSRASFR
jgi:hypothetical protein